MASSIAPKINYVVKPVHTEYALIFIGSDEYDSSKFRCELYNESFSGRQLQAKGFPTAETALQNLLVQFMGKMADEKGNPTALGKWAKTHPLAGLSTNNTYTKLPLRALKVLQAFMGLMPPDEGMELPTL